MAIAVKSKKPLQLVSAKGQWYIIVPWDRADHFYERLKKSGCCATLYADPLDYDARLELWAGVDPAKALAVLEAN